MHRIPADPGTPVIEMRDVAIGTMKDPDVIVAEEVHWTVGVGEFWVIGGAQRSGKSDFLMMTGGLMAPARGSYRAFGEPMPIFEDARRAERLRLGFVFASGQLFNHLTLAENLALPLRYQGHLSNDAIETRVQAMLELMELEPRRDLTPARVARNWQKRAGLARALMLEPEVLLLDSPLAGLDARHAQWWLDFLGQLARGHQVSRNKPMTLVVTTDDLSRAAGRRTPPRRVACLAGKRLRVFGDWSELDRCADPAVRELRYTARAAIDPGSGI